ncbi:hypothetical protein HPB51_025184 [Rhipicephalus microplus]|uniref:Uncharacterized protein n=1 Tax=Rhipicephalus microplus TaxID=6941 RepID=A0A9J6EDK0_RHIMP|nr:hypothetical protein HPB51_025184 [Rhipicephalus microplus]
MERRLIADAATAASRETTRLVPGPSENARQDSHGREAVSVPSVPQKLCTEDHSDKAPTHPHGRASLQVSRMPTDILPPMRPCAASENSFRGATVQVLSLPRQFRSVVNPEKPSPHPNGRASA